MKHWLLIAVYALLFCIFIARFICNGLIIVLQQKVQFRQAF